MSLKFRKVGTREPTASLEPVPPPPFPMVYRVNGRPAVLSVNTHIVCMGGMTKCLVADGPLDSIFSPHYHDGLAVQLGGWRS